MCTGAADCGCWTNSRGEWVLSAECAQEELDAWRRAMDRFQENYIMARAHGTRTPRFVYVDGKLVLTQT